MVLSESIVRAIHADRVRDIERVTRERRLVAATSELIVEAIPRRAPADRRMPPATTRPGLPA